MKTDKLGDWIYNNIALTVVIVFVVDALFFMMMIWLVGCAPRPPSHFDNGDRTVIGPKSWGEVTEPGMAKPEAE